MSVLLLVNNVPTQVYNSLFLFFVFLRVLFVILILIDKNYLKRT